MIKTPKFWYGSVPTLCKIPLYPLSLVYAFFARRNYRRKYQTKIAQKVIAIGGLTVGGSGKTLVVQYIAEYLAKKGMKVAVLSRGYGRSSREILKVDPEKHTYKDVGDEPLLLSKYCPVYVGKNRAESAKFAGEEYDCFILDDGIAQRYLESDVKILVMNGKQGIGNGYMLPLGPNRLKFSWVKDDIDAIVSFDNFQENFLTFQAKMTTPPIVGSVIAFCGLGFPQKFFDSLGSCSIAKCYTFPDHHNYTEDEILSLIKEKHHLSAQLVTTMKDFVKIPKKYQGEIVPIEAQVEIPEFGEWLDTKFNL